MNTHALRELIDELLGAESTFGVQQLLNELSNHLQALMNSPQDQNAQVAYANSVEQTADALKVMGESFTPAKIKAALEIGGDIFLLGSLAGDLRQLTADNPMTPAVVSAHLQKIKKSRANYLQILKDTQDRLETLGIHGVIPDEGTAEIGVLIPRPLFHNHLDEFAKELTVLNNITRIFSELATGTAQPVEVHQISTSDPTIFLGLDVESIKLMGRAVTWALTTLASVLTIRKLRESTVKAKVFTEEEVARMFDSKAKQIVDAAVEAKKQELLAQAHPKSRTTEISGGVGWALESIFAKVERGMTVELRFLPPPQVEQPSAAETKAAKSFEDLKQISSELSFPAPESSPILQLPPTEPPKPTSPESSSRSGRTGKTN